MRQNRYKNYFLDYINRLDKTLLAIVLFISSFGLLLLDSVSRATESNYFDVQLMSVIIGFFGILVLTFIDYNSIANFWILIAGVSIFLMIYTIFFGINIVGSGGVDATAWINIFGRSFQTSELVKIAFMITFAKHASILNEKDKINHPLYLLVLCVHAGVPVLLCNAQGDDGAGVVFAAMFLVMAYIAGVKTRYFVILGVLAIILVPVLWNFVLNDYQKLRFTAVYNLDDPAVRLNEGYQQYQARISIASGGLFGQGLYNGPRVESNLVTFQHSDFIFSVVGEELGFLGCLLVILSLVALMWRTIYIAKNSRDDTGKIMAFGFLGLIMLQTISNIGMCLALLPVMGVTLPFYSAGGSSVLCIYLGVGLLESIYMHKDDVGGIRLRANRVKELSYKDIITKM